MPDERMPKTALFSWLPKTCSRCGRKRRWRDEVKKDLTVLEVGAGSWFEAVQKRNIGMRCTTKEWQSTNISRSSSEGSNRRRDQWSAVYVGDISEEKQTRQDISAPENECYQFPSSQGLSSVHIVTL